MAGTDCWWISLVQMKLPKVFWIGSMEIKRRNQCDSWQRRRRSCLMCGLESTTIVPRCRACCIDDAYMFGGDSLTDGGSNAIGVAAGTTVHSRMTVNRK